VWMESQRAGREGRRRGPSIGHGVVGQ
jgi:hypothetical protein